MRVSVLVVCLAGLTACGDDSGGGSGAVCGNGVRETGEQCDDGNSQSGDGCSSLCRNELAMCGNEVREGTEQCDDGNLIAGDGCSTTCQVETDCGNGIREGSEQCDDGNTADGDGCSATCQMEGTGPRCGNGVREGAEQCDDGNVTSGDGCSDLCRLEAGACGDGVVNSGEQCDDGNTLAGDGCSATCTLEGAFCGNAVIDAGEECDDGNGVGGDGCSAACRTERCGDGAVQTGEECDDGNTVAGDGCDAACALEIPAGCGNGVLEAGEECDDGGTTGGDGCAANCRTEPTGVCLPDWTLACGESDSWSTLYAGATDAIDVYACLPWDESGPEYAYTFVATTASDVTIRLSGTTADLDLFVLADTGGTCDENRCVTGGDFSVTFTTVPGTTYYVVVDGYLGADGPYSLTMSCGACGDGMVDPSEQCDDGNTTSGDGCSAACVLEGCGNGVVEPGEECDAGDTNPCDGCSASCRREECGNFVVECAETCDDGNTAPGDGCSAACAFEGGACATDFALTCGEVDGWSTTFAGSTDTVDFYACVPWHESGREYAYTFTAPRTGLVNVSVTSGAGDLDVFVLGPESAGVCDSSTCLAGGDRAATFDATMGQTYYLVVDGYLGAEGSYEIAVSCGGGACGDGVIDAGEECDDANTLPGDGCSSACRREYCGDGAVQAGLGEQCDDGNTAPGDGCSATCTVEPLASCAPDLLIGCNQVDGYRNDGAGSTDRIDSYACWAGVGSMTGAEYAYAVVPVATTTLTASLTGLTADLDLIVLRDGGACDPLSTPNCVTGGEDTVSFTARAGDRYYLIVDGYLGAASAYTLTVLCDGVACGDGVLEQGEQCDDADTSSGDGCSNVCLLEGGTCQADLQIGCGETDAWDTRSAGSTDRVDAYACIPTDPMTGREYTYRFIAPASGPVTVDVTEMAGTDVDVIVLLSENGVCTPGDCLGQGNTSVTFDAIAGEAYDIVIDGWSGAQGPYAIDVSCP